MYTTVFVCGAKRPTYASEFSDLIERTLGKNAFAGFFGEETGNNKYLNIKLHAVLDSRDMETGMVNIEISMQGFGGALFVLKTDTFDESNYSKHANFIYLEQSTQIEAAHAYLDQRQSDSHCSHHTSHSLSSSRFANELYGNYSGRRDIKDSDVFLWQLANNWKLSELDLKMLVNAAKGAKSILTIREAKDSLKDYKDIIVSTQRLELTGISAVINNIVFIKANETKELPCEVKIFTREKGFAMKTDITNQYMLSKALLLVGIKHAWA